MSRLETWVLAIGGFLFLTRLYGVMNPAGYRKIIDRILALPEKFMQLAGILAVGTGLAFLSIVIHEVSWLPLAGAVIGIALFLGGMLWLLPNVVRDISRMLFFNRHPMLIRTICAASAALGAGFIWLVLRHHVHFS